MTLEFRMQISRYLVCPVPLGFSEGYLTYPIVFLLLLQHNGTNGYGIHASNRQV